MTSQAEDYYHTVCLSSISFTVPKRFERLEFMRCGGHSALVSAHDKLLGRSVVIKKLAHPFQDAKSACRVHRELHMLSAVNHANLISLLGAFSPQLDTGGELQDVYIVTPHLECDLGALLNQRGRLKCTEAIKVTHGLLCGLRYLHTAGILHRDLKPANVALSGDGSLKILDFGLARCANGQDLTEYICTRNYRSPEVLLSCTYGCPADLWSVGCILAEAVLGRVLFPSASVCQQLQEICQLVGKPVGNAADWVSPEASQFIAELHIGDDRQEFQNLFAHLRCQDLGESTCDLLRKLLTFDPALRITGEAALSHPALAKEVKQSPGQQEVAPPGLAIDICRLADSETVTISLDQWSDSIREKLSQLSGCRDV